MFRPAYSQSFLTRSYPFQNQQQTLPSSQKSTLTFNMKASTTIHFLLMAASAAALPLSSESMNSHSLHSLPANTSVIRAYIYSWGNPDCNRLSRIWGSRSPARQAYLYSGGDPDCNCLPRVRGSRGQAGQAHLHSWRNSHQDRIWEVRGSDRKGGSKGESLSSMPYTGEEKLWGSVVSCEFVSC